MMTQKKKQSGDRLWWWSRDWCGSEENLHWKMGKTNVNLINYVLAIWHIESSIVSLPLDIMSLC